MRLSRNVTASIANAGVGIGIALISTPLILHRVGTAGYGVWTIAMAFVLYLAIAEAGFGPAAQRFIAVSHGRGDLDAAARVMWTTLLAYIAVGVVAAVVLLALAGPIVGLFDIPRHLHGDAVHLLRLVGATLMVALLAAAIGNVQVGLERFVPFAAATIAGSVAYLGLVVALVALHADLFQLGFAVLAQQVAMLALRLLSLRDVLATGPPRPVTRRELRELAAFSGKLQMTVLSLLINGQSDRVVVGLVAPASTVGQLGVAAQTAEAGRVVSAAALTPMISRLAAVHGTGDRERLDHEFARLNRLWLLAVLGGTVIGAACVYPILTGWLGHGYGEAVRFGIVLVVAYGLSLLPGTRVAYLRATNQIGPEAMLGAITIGLNVAFTVPLAILVGPLGVVFGTLGAYGLGSAWYLVRFNRYAPPLPATPVAALVRAAVLAALAGAAALGWGAAVVALLPAGVALVPAALGAGVAFGAYLLAVTGTPPSRLLATYRSITSTAR